MTEIFLRIGLAMFCGVVYRRMPGSLPAQEVRKVISSIVLNIFIPLLAFGVMCRAPIGSDLLTVPLVSFTSALVGLVLSWIIYALALRSHLSTPAIGSLILASTWCNALYMGLPITTTVIGEHVSRIPIMFDYLGMTPLLFTVGTLIGSRFGTTDEKVSIGKGLIQALKMPPTLAMAAGLIVNLSGLHVADWFVTACSVAGRVVAPLMLFSIGLTLAVPKWRSLAILMPSALIRTIVVPLFVYPLALAVIGEPDVFHAVMLEAAMPSMMLTMVFAERYGLDESVLAQAIILSVLLSIITLPQVSLLMP